MANVYLCGVQHVVFVVAGFNNARPKLLFRPDRVTVQRPRKIYVQKCFEHFSPLAVIVFGGRRRAAKFTMRSWSYLCPVACQNIH